MKRIVGIAAASCLLIGVFLWILPEKPRLVSCVTAMDTSYITILAKERKDKDKLEKQILQMCREDSFDGMKLHTEKKPLAKRLRIFVYASKKALEQGIPYMEIKTEAKE